MFNTISNLNTESKEDSFKPEKEFFIIESNNLKSVEDSFYGFCIQDNKIVRSLDDIDPNKIDGNGVYVLIQTNQQKITIKQDFIGSYGIYVYQYNDYFAVSNSFQYLVEYIKKHYPITLNEDYATAYLCTGQSSITFSETMFNEIKIIDRCIAVEIDIDSKQLDYSYIDYQEKSIEPDSKEGLKIIDNWFNKWSDIIRAYANKNMQFDLSGGIDSRLCFLLLLGSEVEPDKVYIHSVNNNFHCFAEDYEIATEITEKFNFKLNNIDNIKVQKTKYNLKDLLNIYFYTKLGFHKVNFPSTNNTNYIGICGYYGEMIRKYWAMSEEEFIDKQLKFIKNFYNKASKKHLNLFNNAIKKIIKNSFKEVKEKYKKLNLDYNEKEAGRYYYNETRGRNHFGKALVEYYLMNILMLAPLADTELNKLKTHSSRCNDGELLIALLLDRFFNLLDFRFEGKRVLSKETVEYAKSINKDNPYIKKERTKIVNDTPSNNQEKEDNGEIRSSMDSFIANLYRSKPVKKWFKNLYGSQTYWSIDRKSKRKTHIPFFQMHAAIGIFKAYQDIEINKKFLKNNIVDELIKQCSS